MVIAKDLKREICSLFEVHEDSLGVQRVVTPLEYPGSGDRVVIRVRPLQDGSGFQIDENGESAFYAGLAGGDIDSDPIERWAEELAHLSPVQFTEDEKLQAVAKSERLVAPYIIRVAEAAQQLYALATSRANRQASDFKERITAVVRGIAEEIKLPWGSDVELPIAGGLKADHVLGKEKPLIIIAATSPTRLLEAEVIYMQYRAESKPGYVMAVAESQAAVGKKQYERAAYYTHKSVIYDPAAFPKLISETAQFQTH